ncbi:hypothetical protein ACVWZ3_000289 [Bradyrhizobium sp. i1.3.6]
MILESHLLKAIKENGISKVAIVDDAFDPPAIDEDNAGKLLDYFDSKLFGEIAKELEVAADDIAKAIAAIKEGEYDTEEVSDLLRALYDRFVDTLEDKYDPGSIFSHQKDNIRNLHPILKLLAKCDPKIAIVRIGSDPDSVSGFEDDTHLVFIDFYLKTGVSERDSAAKRKSAKELAIETVTSIIQKQGDNAASVILMSSADVQADAEEFRKKITGEDKSLVFASRFAFVQKTQFRLDQDIVSIPHEAGDDLLDVLQSYEFGRGTHIALEAWFASAKDAAVKLHAQIAQMGLKDFAYLHRFRLAQEGERILPYLEWFFGQCLLDELGRSIDGRLGSEARIKALEGDAQKRIEGTFDGPTKTVASLYHQARIENPRDDKHSTFRLGDLFVSGTGANRTIKRRPKSRLRSGRPQQAQKLETGRNSRGNTEEVRCAGSLRVGIHPSRRPPLQHRLAKEEHPDLRIRRSSEGAVRVRRDVATALCAGAAAEYPDGPFPGGSVGRAGYGYVRPCHSPRLARD